MLFEKKCLNCSEYKRCKDSLASWVFFGIGIIATIALRIVTVLANFSDIYAQAAWYVGVAGFLVFFLYKYRIDTSRARVISDSRIMEKISARGKLEEADLQTIGAILCALNSRKERLNYFFIFASSAIALAVAVYFDLFYR